MHYINTIVLSGSDATTATGDTIDASQLISASFQTHFGDNQAAGVVKIQASNDSGAVHWTDIPTKSSTITSGSPSLITIPQNAYRWLRAMWTTTGTGTQTITTNGAGYGVPQATVAVTIADVSGSLNNTYYVNYAVNDIRSYYIWFNVDGGGTDPAVPGSIGIEVAIASDTSAEDVSLAAVSAINAQASTDFTALDNTAEIIIYNKVDGPASDPFDGPGAHATNFDPIETATPGVDPLPDQLGNQYFFVNAATADGGAEYYLWFNVDGEGVDPGPIAGKTGIEVDIFSTDPANGVANAVQSALQTLTEFTDVTVTPADGNLVTFSNVSAGSFIPASDFNTTFLFAVTSGGSSTVTTTMDAVST